MSCLCTFRKFLLSHSADSLCSFTLSLIEENLSKNGQKDFHAMCFWNCNIVMIIFRWNLYCVCLMTHSNASASDFNWSLVLHMLFAADDDIEMMANSPLTDSQLSAAVDQRVTSPNRVFCTSSCHAAVSVGFPDCVNAVTLRTVFVELVVVWYGQLVWLEQCLHASFIACSHLRIARLSTL